MTQSKRRRTAYDDSLFRIFLWSGFDVLICLLSACGLIALIAHFSHRMTKDIQNLIIWCFVLTLPLSYFMPLVSLLKARKQERILGIFWKDRTDSHRPVCDRDWFLSFDLGGFLLCHRSYIQEILGFREVEQTTSNGRSTTYYVVCRNIQGKTCKFKFSSLYTQNNFLQWYGRHPVEP